MLFFAETFQPMNAALTFQIGLNDSARAIRGKFTFAGAWEGFWGIRTICKHSCEIDERHIRTSTRSVKQCIRMAASSDIVETMYVYAQQPAPIYLYAYSSCLRQISITGRYQHVTYKYGEIIFLSPTFECTLASRIMNVALLRIL